jgi:predicted ester cyclase
MLQQQKDTSAQVIRAIYTLQQTDLIEELFHPEYVQKPLGYSGWAGVQRYVSELHTAFPNLHFELIDQIGEADGVVNLVLMTGTQQGPLFTHIPASQRDVTLMYVIIHRYVAGQIVEGVVITDQLQLMQQIGVVPRPVWDLLKRD